jgi:amino-acid N-acetyltransferase
MLRSRMLQLINTSNVNTTIQTTVTKATSSQREPIINLLQTEKLPVDDLPASLDNFFVATDNDKVIGAIGLELYRDCGLLRSMVVNKEHRNKNIASQLVHQLEEYAASIGINCMYLLTETAADYFERRGYHRITREEVPKELQASSEFSHVCPVSAIVMKKPLH